MFMGTWEDVRCMVLNANYQPINVLSAKQAISLVVEGRASIIDEHATYIIRSARSVWAVPTQIVLTDMVKVRSPYLTPAVLTQRNLFLRDDYQCQYCNRYRFELIQADAKAKLTRDHVVPRAMGGKDVWSNVVTACSKCNNAKADLMLSNTSMTLRKTPKTPMIGELWEKTNRRFRTKKS